MAYECSIVMVRRGRREDTPTFASAATQAVPLWVRERSGFWQSAALTGRWRLAGACIEYNFPRSIDSLFPDGDVTAGGDDGLTVLIDGVAFVVSPGEAGVIGRKHLSSLRRPGEQIGFGVPGGGGGYVAASEDYRTAVVESNCVVGKPGSESFATARGNGLGETAFEIVKKNGPRREGGLGEGRCGGRRRKRKGAQGEGGGGGGGEGGVGAGPNVEGDGDWPGRLGLGGCCAAATANGRRMAEIARNAERRIWVRC